MTEVEEELRRLAERVARLEARDDATPALTSAPRPPGVESGADGDTFWVLDGLRRRTSGDGAVVFAGSVRLDAPTDATGREVSWQYGQSTAALLDRSWEHTGAPAALAALGHPLRLRLLQQITRGLDSVTSLAALDGVGTSGQVYHHLGQLQATGWVRQAGRGRYEVPPDRVVPLMTIVLASGGAW